MIYNGYSKLLYESNSDSILEDNYVLDYLKEVYNFEKVNISTVVLHRFQDSYIIFKQSKKIIISYIVDIDLDRGSYKKVALELMRLNHKYKLNLSIQHNNITCDYTFFTPNGVNDEAFIETWEAFSTTIDSCRSVIIDVAKKYALSFMEDTYEERLFNKMRSDNKFDNDDDDDDDDLRVDYHEIEHAIREGDYYIESDNDE